MSKQIDQNRIVKQNGISNKKTSKPNGIIKEKLVDLTTNSVDNIIDDLVDVLEQKDFKKKLIKKLNKNVNIPFINEKTEKVVLESLYDNIIEVLRQINLNDNK